jgi:hypothetical protein
VAGDAFLGLEVDQEKRRGAYRALARAERELHGHLDAERADRAQRQVDPVHARRPAA